MDKIKFPQIIIRKNPSINKGIISPAVKSQSNKKDNGN